VNDMKKFLVVLALLTVSTVGLAVEIVPDGNSGIYIIDGKKVYYCSLGYGCQLVDDNYTQRDK